MENTCVGIHPTAVIESGAQLGEDVTVGAFAFIDSHVQIGDRTIIAPHATILRYTTLGSDCQVHANAVLGDLPQDLAYQDQESYVKIGNNCAIREGVTIHRGTKFETTTEVGDECLLMAHSHVAHNAKLGHRVILANGALVAGYAEIGDRAFISGNCLVHQFARVGRLAMMAGGAAVQKDIPPFCITRSMSPNTVIGINTVGMRRAGFSTEERLIMKRAFKVLYQSGLNVSQALIQLAEFDSPLVAEFREFVQSSQRGICKFIKSKEWAEENSD
jgi:UDP-N-acetylglucosamine acyltransferase